MNACGKIVAEKSNCKNCRIVVTIDMECKKNVADTVKEPDQNRWAKKIEHLSDGKLEYSRIDDPKFPTEEVKEILKDKKDWMNEFADELIMEYMCYHTGF